ncbi:MULTISPECIES: hypothetical protein [unclassified Rhizobium]|uniref:hypothetical protein n=1 Tax=unclassified Rhizobium TaxID=2613769 RepID=UPI00160DBC7D|nr:MULTISPECIES: hypothetical protein [unclassified Rhizobium]MBB3318992.1 hypothetical protein [Rhizobium sp. BK181]MCS3742671.1 hypothetical protein [Rhizobium sp. BK661]MCS4094637.1 hypothetical protein [Rhizobium sp. BK176]
MTASAARTMVADDLLELGLDLDRLSENHLRTLWGEFKSLRAEEPHIRSVAIRIFVWYVVESKLFNSAAMRRSGAIGRSIATMRAWAETDPALTSVVLREAEAVKLFLYQIFERADAPRQTILEAQKRLLQA